MKSKLFIPERINVGFQMRGGTYTGKLAYIIYWDSKGKLRKEKSWESWRHKEDQMSRGDYNRDTREYENKEYYGDKVKPQAFENVPTEGFVLNKGVGGARQSYGWNTRNEYIRVYDPRGFEFEISVANLLFILQENSCIQGKGLEGEFVYSWAGTELVLLPVGAEDYKESKRHTELQGKKVTKKDMTEGCAYIHKDGRELIYLGRHEFYTLDYWKNASMKKVHVFYHEDHPEGEDRFVSEKGFTKLAEKVSDDPVSNYADILEDFMSSRFYNKISKLITTPLDEEATYEEGRRHYRRTDDYKFFIFQGKIMRGQFFKEKAYKNDRWGYNRNEDGWKICPYGYYLSQKEGLFKVESTPYYDEHGVRPENFEATPIDLKIELENGTQLSYEDFVL